MRWSILLLLISLTVFGSCLSIDNAKKERTEEELKGYFAGQHLARLEALENNDIEKALDSYAEDAALFDIGATAIGKNNIRAHLLQVLESMELKNTKNIQKEVEVSGDLAYDYGITSMELHYLFDGKMEEVQSKYIAIWRKKGDNDWKIVKLIFNQEG
jgi:ketosteroid isomerase-like protein